MLFSILKNIHQLLHSNFRVHIAYKFCILVIFGFFVSIFFNPLVGVPAQDSIFYLNAIGAALCLMFLLGDFWVPEGNKNILPYFWNFILFFCLPFSSMYTLTRSEFYFSWIFHFGLASLLLYLIAESKIFIIILCVGALLGFVSGYVLNYYVPPNPKPPFLPLDVNFALYSSIFLILMIVLLIHNRMYVQKQLYVLVEEKVKERTKQLNKALEVKREFLDNVSHEIKTPIHNITNITAELYEQWENLSEEERKHLVRMLKDCNHRLLSLCSNLLDLSRFKKGEDGLIIKSYTVVELLEYISNEYKHYGQKISFISEERIGKEVECDIDRIVQVFRNFIDNAIKYGDNSEVVVSIVEYDENHIKASVSDRGIGVPHRELKTIFAPFEQSSTTKTRAGGTGLGLSICKKIIKMHHGKIWAENNQSSSGATFSFVIPYKNI